MQRDSSKLKKSYCDGELQREKLKQPEDFIQFNTCADPEYVFFYLLGRGVRGYQCLPEIPIFGNLIW